MGFMVKTSTKDACFEANSTMFKSQTLIDCINRLRITSTLILKPTISVIVVHSIVVVLGGGGRGGGCSFLKSSPSSLSN